jgi:hypothetical protein
MKKGDHCVIYVDLAVTVGQKNVKYAGFQASIAV